MLFKRSASCLVDGARRGVRLSEAPGEGIEFLPGVELANGTIEIDVRGKDVAQQSFVGVAFHGGDAAAHDAVYFGPFNFKAPLAATRSNIIRFLSMRGRSCAPTSRESTSKR